MSKPAQQIIPSHITVRNGKPFNCDTAERDIQELKDYAEQEQFDLETECRTQYGVPVEWVTREQHSALLLQAVRHRNKRLEASGFHHHRCVECGEVSKCLEPNCKKSNEIECRICHDGDLKMTRTEYWLHNRQAVMR